MACEATTTTLQALRELNYIIPTLHPDVVYSLNIIHDGHSWVIGVTMHGVKPHYKQTHALSCFLQVHFTVKDPDSCFSVLPPLLCYDVMGCKAVCRWAISELYLVIVLS